MPFFKMSVGDLTQLWPRLSRDVLAGVRCRRHGARFGFAVRSNAPPEPFVPAELHLSPAFAFVLVGLGDEDAHARLIAPIKETLTPIMELNHADSLRPVAADVRPIGALGDALLREGVYVEEFTDGPIAAILEHQAKKMSPLSELEIFVLGGAYGRANGDATAFGGSRDIRYAINVSATALSLDDFEAERAWVRAYWSAFVPHAVGVGSYVNMMTEYEEDRVHGAYGPKYERLQQIKAVYDPDNIFHLNANIKPGDTSSRMRKPEREEEDRRRDHRDGLTQSCRCSLLVDSQTDH